jgi:hypothetical protein
MVDVHDWKSFNAFYWKRKMQIRFDAKTHLLATHDIYNLHFSAEYVIPIMNICLNLLIKIMMGVIQ